MSMSEMNMNMLVGFVLRDFDIRYEDGYEPCMAMGIVYHVKNPHVEMRLRQRAQN